MIQPAAHVGNKIFKTPWKFLYTPQKIIPLLPQARLWVTGKTGGQMLAIIISFVIGTWTGIFLAALMEIAHRSDRE